MKNPTKNAYGSASGVELIFMGLALSLLGATSVAFMVLGLSYMYVGVYGPAFLLLGGCAASGFVFLKAYGPFISRLELRAPRKTSDASAAVDGQADIPNAQSPDSDEIDKPLPTGVIVALAAAAYGVIILFAAILWTQGSALVLNLIAAAALLLTAACAWMLGRRKD